VNIYAPRGSKVVFEYPDNGYDYDRKQCKTLLDVGATYTIESTIVGSFHTHVYLMEHPGVSFNSVMFSDADGDN
jgi:hypothetical protein